MSVDEVNRPDVSGAKKGTRAAMSRDGALAEVLSPEALSLMRRRETDPIHPLIALVNLEAQQSDGKEKVTDRKPADWFRELPPKELTAVLAPLTDVMTDPAVVSSVRKPLQLGPKFNKDFEDFGKSFKAAVGRELKDEDWANPRVILDLIKDKPALMDQFDTVVRGAAAQRSALALRNQALEVVAQSAQRVLNDLCKSANLPPVKFEFSNEATTAGDAMLIGGSYKYGAAVLSLPVTRFDEILEKALTKKTLTHTLAHEMEHHRQFCLVTAKAIADISGGKPLREEDIKTLQDNLQARFGPTPTREFILDVEKSRKGHPLTDNEIEQAKVYEQAFAKWKEVKGKGVELAVFQGIDQILTQQNAFEAIDLLNEMKPKYIHTTSLDEIAPLLEQQRKIKSGALSQRSWDEKAAKETLKAWLTKTSDSLRRTINSEYNGLKSERDADTVGESAARTIP